MTFMALLDMLARGEAHVRQGAPFAPITVRAGALRDDGDDDAYAFMDEVYGVEGGNGVENRMPPESRQAQAAAAAPQAGEGRPRTEAAAPLRHRLACMLFVAGDPVARIGAGARARAAGETGCGELLREMEAECRAAGAGVYPLVTEETAQLVSNPAYAADVEALLQPERTRSVSQSLLETLAIIAYRQPVTRGDIEAVRGVRCEYAVGQLQKLGLVQTVGHRDTVGRPALLGTTDAFLRRFGLHSLAELPEYERFAGLADGEALEDADQSAMG